MNVTRRSSVLGSDLTGKLFVLAPVLVLVYSLVRLLDGLDGSFGPGLAWTVGHLAFLAALALFVPLVLELARRARHRRTAVGLAAFGLLGVAAGAVQFGIDLVVGFLSADRPEMGAYFDRIQQVPGILPAVYTVGPTFFYVGLVALVAMQAIAGRIGWWSPALVTIGIGAVVASKDLLPLSALLNLAGLAPLGRARADE